MTLSELANYVANKTQFVEASDIAAAKGFISKRYELIYNSYLWKDSLTMVDLSVDPTTDAGQAGGIIQLPTQIERVVGVRNANNAIKVHGLEEYFRNDWNRFADTSDTNGLIEFAILNPVWFTCRPISGSYYLTVVSAGVAGAVGQYDYNSSTGNFVKDADYYINYASWLSKWRLLFQDIVKYDGATPYTMTNAMYPPDPTVTCSITSSYQTIPGETLTVTSDNPADLATGANPIQVKIQWRDTQDRYTYKGTLPVTLTPADGSGFIEVESVFKDTSLGNITFTLSKATAGVGCTNVVGTLSASATKSPRYGRIRVFGKPNTAMTVSVLGKKPFVPLDFDNEQPLIQNLDNCLIAFGMADMLKRARQFGKASQELQEATILLQELAKLETMQAANHTQFVPDSGYGDPYFGASSNRGLWM